ncbi:hypothetical protein COT48_00045 [Candidatus Woesearchaeota archaeon CG08_land_8_20_14_0_20_47_9]|nr:MAG: hypothetical protein COV22_00655 [Candidatus Woesearchaeota archaeon CG10_big_fil_rev_8_21_14_0_10_47_5]PIO04510.1 MAG: hypothetical protein COT48_00045 [Candidatus Woesearchaeota archaeon CG08_land_8_20_14_0_20_47_9]
MQVFIEPNRHINMRFNGSAASLLKKLRLNQDSVLIVKNGKLVTEKERLGERDNIKIMRVFSGG